ncbi:hypothetical protein TKK_0001989 [Trichogramma kaykai]|uniref:Uncharacterized protein n=1 Tax=Trichogramma kaykai TaxID=54128 RepID=A0ABD2X947_9HYME
MAHRIAVFICFVTILALINADIPKSIKICGRRNPQLNQCVINATLDLMPKLKTGVPELDLSSIEPIRIDNLVMADIDNFHAYATNVTLGGLSEFKINLMNVDLESGKVDIEFVFPKIHLKSNYEVKAKILIPINEKGPIDLITENTLVKARMLFKKVNHRGRVMMYWTSMKMKIKITDYTANFVSSDDSPMTQAINQVLATNRQEIIDSMTPSFEKSLSAKVLELGNQICKRFSFDELYPDRE